MQKVSIDILNHFSKSINKMAKKNYQIYDHLETLVDSLITNPTKGESMGKGIYKIRLKTENKGKRAGYRVVYYFINQNHLLYLVNIYSKNQQEDMSKEEVLQILKSEGIKI